MKHSTFKLCFVGVIVRSIALPTVLGVNQKHKNVPSNIFSLLENLLNPRDDINCGDEENNNNNDVDVDTSPSISVPTPSVSLEPSHMYSPSPSVGSTSSTSSLYPTLLDTLYPTVTNFPTGLSNFDWENITFVQVVNTTDNDGVAFGILSSTGSDFCPGNDKWNCIRLEGKTKKSKFGSSISVSSDGSRAVVRSNKAFGVYNIEGNKFQIVNETCWPSNWADYGNFVSMSGNRKAVVVGGRLANGKHSVLTSFEKSFDSQKDSSWQTYVGSGSSCNGVSEGVPSPPVPNNKAYFYHSLENSHDDNRKRYGYSVSTSHDYSRVLVGSYNNNKGKGDVTVYDTQGTDTNSDEWTNHVNINGYKNGDLFGFSSALSGNGKRFVVGGYKGDLGKTNAGYVEVYEYKESSSTKWVRLGSNTPIKGTDKNQGFGYSMAMSYDGERMIVSSLTKLPEVWQWENGANEWVKCGSLLPPDQLSKNHKPGYSVDISYDGKKVAFSAPYFDNKKGRVYVFEEGSKCTWTLSTVFAGSDKNDMFGSDVSFAGDMNKLMVGAQGSHKKKKGYVVSLTHTDEKGGPSLCLKDEDEKSCKTELFTFKQDDIAPTNVDYYVDGGIVDIASFFEEIGMSGVEVDNENKLESSEFIMMYTVHKDDDFNLVGISFITSKANYLGPFGSEGSSSAAKVPPYKKATLAGFFVDQESGNIGFYWDESKRGYGGSTAAGKYYGSYCKSDDSCSITYPTDDGNEDTTDSELEDFPAESLYSYTLALSEQFASVTEFFDSFDIPDPDGLGQIFSRITKFTKPLGLIGQGLSLFEFFLPGQEEPDVVALIEEAIDEAKLEIFKKIKSWGERIEQIIEQAMDLIVRQDAIDDMNNIENDLISIKEAYSLSADEFRNQCMEVNLFNDFNKLYRNTCVHSEKCKLTSPASEPWSFLFRESSYYNYQVYVHKYSKLILQLMISITEAYTLCHRDVDNFSGIMRYFEKGIEEAIVSLSLTKHEILYNIQDGLKDKDQGYPLDSLDGKSNQFIANVLNDRLSARHPHHVIRTVVFNSYQNKATAWTHQDGSCLQFYDDDWNTNDDDDDDFWRRLDSLEDNNGGGDENDYFTDRRLTNYVCNTETCGEDFKGKEKDKFSEHHVKYYLTGKNLQSAESGLAFQTYMLEAEKHIFVQYFLKEKGAHSVGNFANDVKGRWDGRCKRKTFKHGRCAYHGEYKNHCYDCDFVYGNVIKDFRGNYDYTKLLDKDEGALLVVDDLGPKSRITDGYANRIVSHRGMYYYY